MENQVIYCFPLPTSSLTSNMRQMWEKPVTKNLHMPIPCTHEILFLDFSLAKIDLTILYCCEKKIMSEKK